MIGPQFNIIPRPVTPDSTQDSDKIVDPLPEEDQPQSNGKSELLPEKRFLRNNELVNTLKRRVVGSLPMYARIEFKDFLYHLRTLIESHE